MTRLDSTGPASVYDCALRWSVPSRTNPHESYVVALGDFNGNGCCACDDFKFNFGKLLCRRITPEMAIAKGLVKWPNPKRAYQLKPSHALSCAHIMEARDQACSQFIRALSAAEKHNETDCPY